MIFVVPESNIDSGIESGIGYGVGGGAESRVELFQNCLRRVSETPFIRMTGPQFRSVERTRRRQIKNRLSVN